MQVSTSVSMHLLTRKQMRFSLFTQSESVILIMSQEKQMYSEDAVAKEDLPLYSLKATA